MLQRPIFGGVFGEGRYSLATMPCVSNGLHAVRFLVIDARAGSVLSMAEDKREALSAARRVLKASGIEHEAANDPLWVQEALWPDMQPQPAPKVKRPSRRRLRIFEKCEGRCHYCSTPLDPSGRWHVEHMQPRALGGTDDPRNLVAACVECNLSKRDRTALEFLTDPGR